ncbi:hypothetical protein [Algoriphagus sediminis]|uniref:GAF domain-containing protein n=1 Tax=Algoriphagus sediminis TaxID=3057113 RepID=A0ABT7Y965_9BACT|nr:hypothetical protein [Algoriphagus sediminis]MDN3203058.1 hypothetical protein [Algoriphagus sediminis]
METHNFLNWLYSTNHLESLGDTVVYLKMESDSSLVEILLDDYSRVDDLDQIRNFENGQVSDYIAQRSWEQFISQTSEPYLFDSSLLNNHIRVLSNETLSTFKEESKEIVYKVLSKPVFLNEGKYCGVIVSTQCSPIPCGGSSLFFFEKTGDTWLSRVSITLIIV